MDRLLGTTMLTSVAVLAAATALANPQGGTVVDGQATITQSPGLTTIDQSSHKAILNWQSFSIDKGETTRFNQPSSSAIALNRVTGNDPSQLMGKLEANGKVWLINPNGILAGPSAQINVHSFLGTTADIPNADFLAGRYDFSIPSPNPDASVVNQGTISIGETGLAGLVAPHVRNDGVIAAKLGNVILAGASTFTVDFQGDGLIQFAATSDTTVDSGMQRAAVQNSGQIEAEGGTVLITASAAAGIVENAINMDGVIEAQTIAMHDGAIVLDGGDSGVVEVAGTLDASGNDTGETGGTVKVLGETVELSSNANVNASGDAGGGEVLIGGNFQGSGPETNAKQTTVAENATINADATTDGDGGRVIVWADQTNIFAGSITARGGSDAGDGGFVEVSGKENLAYAGEIDVGAAAGNAGEILFDPRNIFIVEASDSPGDDGEPVVQLALISNVVVEDNEADDESNGISLINNNELEDNFVAFDDGYFPDKPALSDFTIEDTAIEDLTGTVRLQAYENITINADLSLQQTKDQSFVLQAGNDIIINGEITTKGGNVHLEADSPHMPDTKADGSGDILQRATINTNGGNLTAVRVDFLFQPSALLQTGRGAYSETKSQDGVALPLNNLRNVRSSGTLTFGQATTAGPEGDGDGGDVLTAGTLTLNHVDAPISVTGPVRLVANNGVTANNSFITPGSLSVIADADADDNNTGAIQTRNSAFLSAPDLSLSAGSGINVNTRRVSNLAAETQTGGITLTNSGSSVLTVATVDSRVGLLAEAGDIDVYTQNSDLTINQTVQANGESSSISLGTGTTQRTDLDLTINAPIDGDFVELEADRNIIFSSTEARITANTAHLYADYNEDADGAITNSGNGSIQASRLIMSAATGIGSEAAPVLTQGGVDLSAVNSSQGGLFVTNQDSGLLQVVSFPQQDEGSIGASLSSSSGVLSSGEAGDIHLVNQVGGITVDATINSLQGKVCLYSEGTLSIGAPINASTNGTAILIDTLQFSSPLATPLATPNGRYLVYSGDVENDTNNIPAQQFSRRYGVAYNPNDPEGVGLSPPIPPEGNFFVYENSPTIIISGAAFQDEESVDEITYGEAVSLNLVVNEEGLVEGDSLGDALRAEGELSLDPDSDPAQAPAGDYQIVLSEEGLSSPIGYTLEFEPGSLLVNPAPLTLTGITPASASREYGDANPVFSAVFEGLKLDDDNTVPGPIFEGLPRERAPVTDSAYRIELTGISNQNYVLDPSSAQDVVGLLTITPAPVTVTDITPDPFSRRFGEPNPAYAATFDLEDLKFADDTVGEAIFDAPGSEAAVGTYTVSVSEFANPNYVPTLPPDSDTAQLTISEEPSPDDFDTPNDPATDNLNAEFTAALQGDTGPLIEDSIVQAAPVAPPSQRFEGPWQRRETAAGLITPANQGRPEIW